MAAEKALALVLRVVDFSETSAVVGLFTREFGKMHALAKGAKRPKGPFDSALDLLSQCRIVFLRRSAGALDLLTEARLERRFHFRRRDLSSLYAGYYVAELLSELAHEDDPQPELFDVTAATLVELEGSMGVPILTLRYEMSVLRLMGHLPTLTTCAGCGAAIQPAGRIPFGHAAGGALCAACRPGQKDVSSLSTDGWRAMQTLSQPDDAWRGLENATAIRGELRGLLNHFWNHLLGKRLRLTAYLGA
jgi:DNA repair protein RecO (recombination protein O)